jgi:hypothetical protein
MTKKTISKKEEAMECIIKSQHLDKKQAEDFRAFSRQVTVYSDSIRVLVAKSLDKDLERAKSGDTAGELNRNYTCMEAALLEVLSEMLLHGRSVAAVKNTIELLAGTAAKILADHEGGRCVCKDHHAPISGKN